MSNIKNLEGLFFRYREDNKHTRSALLNNIVCGSNLSTFPRDTEFPLTAYTQKIMNSEMNDNDVTKAVESLRDALFDGYSIACFCQRPPLPNYHMWETYGKNGFCLVYTGASLTRCINKYNKKELNRDRKYLLFRKVLYKESYDISEALKYLYKDASKNEIKDIDIFKKEYNEKICNIPERERQILANTFCTKPDKFKNENEIRIIKANKTKNKHPEFFKCVPYMIVYSSRASKSLISILKSYASRTKIQCLSTTEFKIFYEFFCTDELNKNKPTI